MLLAPDRALDLSAPSNLNRLVSFLHDKLIPFVERPRVDIHGVHTESGSTVSADDQAERIVNTLRMIGMVR